MENLDTQVLENTETQAEVKVEPVVVDPVFSWKSQLNTDFANSPTMKLFPDTKEGFNAATKSHLELQKMMGHDKVPVPKDSNDLAAINLFKKAFKVPDKPEGYGLPDPEMPDSMKEIKFDKTNFQAGLHKFNVTPEQAKGLWQTYTDMVKSQYMNAVKKHQDDMAETTNKMRAEWGDAYQSKVEVGQLVINKFSENQEMNDFITATLVKDPMGIKFLAKIGEQFAENKIGDFKYQRHSQTPDEIDRELSSIRSDMNHPYNNDKAGRNERDKAIEYVNTLIAAKARTRTS